MNMASCIRRDSGPGTQDREVWKAKIDLIYETTSMQTSSDRIRGNLLLIWSSWKVRDFSTWNQTNDSSRLFRKSESNWQFSERLESPIKTVSLRWRTHVRNVIKWYARFSRCSTFLTHSHLWYSVLQSYISENFKWVQLDVTSQVFNLLN